MDLKFPKPQSAPKKPKPLKRSTPMRSVSRKKAAHRASEEGKAGLAHMERVRGLPCVICYHWGMVPAGRIVAHHVFHGRFSQGRADDLLTIPLCCGHHNQDEPGEYPSTHIPIHHQKATWVELYGEDHTWMPWVQDMLEAQQ